MKSDVPPATALAPLILIVTLFFLWGVANNLNDVLIPLGPLTKTAASFLVMSIIGGAVLTAVMGAVSDAAAINYAILVPTGCFLVIGWFAWTAANVPVSHFTAATAGAHSS